MTIILQRKKDNNMEVFPLYPTAYARFFPKKGEKTEWNEDWAFIRFSFSQILLERTVQFNLDL